ncbi:aminotransferase [Rhizobium sp. BR 314]|uniref:aminotransferase n=1 Tax=Rhizobium sp. BR 314 TaxID=3040013 RepID=UPI0039BF1D32
MMKAMPNSLVSRLPGPPIPAVTAWARTYDGLRGPLIDLSQAVPGYPTHPEMLRLLGEAAGMQAMTGYGPIEGESVLRQTYAAHMSNIYASRICTENIHITAGCNQAFMATMIALARAGDRVAITNPFYFNHETTLSMLGIGSVLVECDAENGFLPKMSSVEAALADGVKALVIVSPNNPTGAIYSPDLLDSLYALCRKHGAWLVLDETYRDFLDEGSTPPHGLLSQMDWNERLVLLYSFSKSLCIPGHRLGAITASPEVIQEISKVMDNMQICAPRAVQHAVSEALPKLASWRAANRAEIARRAKALTEVFAAAPEWSIAAIGAYFAFIKHPFEGQASTEIAERLASTAGVISIPGAFFGEGNDAYLRFAFANADVVTIRQLNTRLDKFPNHP